MKSKDDRLTFCVDLDGTLCNTDEQQPIPERYYNSTPKHNMINVINKFYKQGHTIVIETARGSKSTGLTKYIKLWRIKQLTKRQLKEWNVMYHSLRVGVKIPADLYIDDKALPINIFERR